MRITDRTAARIGWLTAGATLSAPLTFLIGLFLLEEHPTLLGGWLAPGLLIGVLFLAWTIAYFTMVVHQRHRGHLSVADVEDWDRRQDSKLGCLVPFIYLLGGPEQRRVLTYLRKEKGPRRDRGRD